MITTAIILSAYLSNYLRETFTVSYLQTYYTHKILIEGKVHLIFSFPI